MSLNANGPNFPTRLRVLSLATRLRITRVLPAHLDIPAHHPVPPRSVSLHDISAADYLAHLHDSSMGSDGTITTAPSDDTDTSSEAPDRLLAHLTKQSPLPPGELKRVMSDKLAAQKATPHKTNANKHEITIDGVTYRACMHNIIYSKV